MAKDKDGAAHLKAYKAANDGRYTGPKPRAYSSLSRADRDLEDRQNSFDATPRQRKMPKK